ncbi:MAG: cation diffusion facilitator family transporter [Clostridium sp.]|nr:cation diffusion facilitator family transporter [Clostridium sp.]
MNSKVKAARMSIVSNTMLIIMKFIIGIISGSVSIISEAIHSCMDLIASVIAFFSVRVSDKPADKNHPYGHGKIENISGVIEAILIFIASAIIIYESVNKILNPKEIAAAGLGFLVMFVSSFVNFMVSKKLYKIAKQEQSIALEADALHLKSDVLTSLGVGIGLLIMYITKIKILDPIVAILVAVFILKEAFELLREALKPLLDGRLTDEEIETIENIIAKNGGKYCSYHDLKTRRSGSSKHIDMHLVVPEDMSVKDSHIICDNIENEIEKVLKNTDVMIHVERCDKKCSCFECNNNEEKK